MFEIGMVSGTKSRKVTNMKYTWESFKELFIEPAVKDITQAEYQNLSKDKQGEYKNNRAFIGGKSINGKRNKESIPKRQILTLDIDNLVEGDEILDEYADCFGHKGLAYTTFSHTVELPRYRLVIPLSRECNQFEYESIGNSIIDFLGKDKFDRTTLEMNRYMYLPNRCSDGEYKNWFFDGEILDVDNIIGEFESIIDLPFNSKMENPTLKKGPIGSFCRTYDVHAAIEKFIPDVYTYENVENRYTYSNGSTSNGVIVYDDGLFTYSNHGTDPCNGKCMNAFDLVRVHKFSGDVNDFSTTSLSYLQMVELCKSDELVMQDEAMESSNNDDEQPSKAAQIKEMVLKENIELCHTKDDVAYARIFKDGHYETLKMSSEKFRIWVMMLYENKPSKVAGKNTLSEAINSLSGYAISKGKEIELHLRVANMNNCIYVDLCNDNWEVVEISKNGVKVLQESPVYFRRLPDMAQLPTPIIDGKPHIQDLKKYLNYRDEDQFNLLVSWILGMYLSDVPKPILNLQGEAGTGKSFNSRMLRKLVDPALQKEIIKKELSDKEITHDAKSQYLLSYDNLSGLNGRISDIFCVLSTGGATTTRALYTNDEEVVTSLMRAVILNGIDSMAKRQDLLSRSIIINLPVITERKSEKELKAEFENDWPYILGHLYYILSEGLKVKENSKTVFPRMQDFGIFISKCSAALDWEPGYFEKIYLNSIRDGELEILETDPFASSIISLMNNEYLEIDDPMQNNIVINGLWEGIPRELVKILRDIVPYEDRKNGSFPSERKVRERLNRIAPLLKTVGITWHNRDSNGKRMIVITKNEDDLSDIL